MLTRKQFELLRFVHDRLKESGVPPSFDEMKDALDLRSKSGIHRLITALERDGRRLDRPWMLAVAARGRAMWLAARGDLAAAVEHAQRALAEHDRALTLADISRRLDISRATGHAILTTLAARAVVAGDVEDERIVGLSGARDGFEQPTDLVIGVIEKSREYFGLPGEQALLVL